MDVKAALMGTLTQLQSSAPRGGEAYQGYESLKEEVQRTSDKAKLALMYKELREVLATTTKTLQEELGVEYTAAPPVRPRLRKPQGKQ